MNSSSDKVTNSRGNGRGMHPNSLKNLKKGRKFGSGQKGNPDGRPRKEYSIISLIKGMLNQVADERWLEPEDYGLTWQEAIAKALLIGAVKGNPTAIKELLDRLEGKPTIPIETSGEAKVTIIEKIKDYGNPPTRQSE